MRDLLLRITLALICVGLWSSPQMAQAQHTLEGEWVGGLDSGKQWLDINVRFQIEGEVVKGALDLPRFGVINQPLSQINVKTSRVYFEWARGELGKGVFDGEIKDGGITGNYQRGAVKSTFVLVRVAKVDPSTYDKHAGNYRLGPNRFVAISPGLDFLDTETDRKGQLYPLSETIYFSGPSIGIPFPVDIRVTFVRDKQGEVTGLTWAERGSRPVFGKRLPHKEETVTFRNGDTTLSGILVSPASKGPHPAVVIVSPGYRLFSRPSALPYFFIQQGFAFLQLTGRTIKGSPADYNRASFEERARDVLAGVELLKSRKDINPKQIGLHGSSLSSWVAPLASTLSSDVAFLILRVGSAIPVADNILYEIENDLREQDFSEEEITRTVALRRLLNTTILTNSGWDTLKSEIEKSRNERWFGYARVAWFSTITTPPDAATLKGLQDPISYDPVPILEKVTVPLLAFNGELDKSVNTKVSVPIMEAALRKAGNKDFTIIVLPKANHDLSLAETGHNSEVPRLKYNAPGYWNTMAAWLGMRINVKR